ncbi:MAG: hypothetical protein OXG16_12745 [Rhodospirillales bacterium]|nr:hypothetical protein [Rhodospirillales bacterium]
MDKLTAAIAAKHDEYQRLASMHEALEKKLGIVEAELQALKLAAELRPAQTGNRRKGGQQSGGHGRRRGAISPEWREILRVLAKHGNPPRPHAEIIKVVNALGKSVTNSTVRDRVRKYCNRGILEETATGYRVTQHAIQHYGLKEEGPDSSESGPSEGAAGSPHGSQSHRPEDGSIPSASTLSEDPEDLLR